ncbi:hypothetical protein [Bifidobacterium angulatum]|uniref:hypothetical protein n=1 Tax=Bifidobacterium angulatum TaxID=1683 RepID=UPI0034A5CB3E
MILLLYYSIFIVLRGCAEIFYSGYPCGLFRYAGLVRFSKECTKGVHYVNAQFLVMDIELFFSYVLPYSGEVFNESAVDFTW